MDETLKDSGRISESSGITNPPVESSDRPIDPWIVSTSEISSKMASELVDKWLKEYYFKHDYNGTPKGTYNM